MILTPEVLSDLRTKANAAGGEAWVLERDDAGPRYIMDGVVPIVNVYSTDTASADHIATANPAAVLALLDRIEALEKDKADALEDLRSAKATLERVNAGLLRLREVGDW